MMKNDKLILLGGALAGLVLPGSTEASRANQISVADGALRITDSNLNWKDVVSVIDDYLFPFDTHTFTNASAAGQNGPTLAQVRTAYAAKPWASADFGTDFLDVTSGVQVFTVPQTGDYRIAVRGATNPQLKSSATASVTLCDMAATFRLTKGQKVHIIVGQMGQSYSPTSATTRWCGGGGGTFVYCEGVDILQPLLVSGGAGGIVSSDSIIWTGSRGELDGTAGRGRVDGESVNNGIFGGSGGVVTGSGGSAWHGGSGGGWSVPGGNSGASFSGKNAFYRDSFSGKITWGGQGGKSPDVQTGNLCQGGFGGGASAGSRDDTTRYAGGGGGYSGGQGGRTAATLGQQAYAGCGGNYSNAVAVDLVTTYLGLKVPAQGFCTITKL